MFSAYFQTKKNSSGAPPSSVVSPDRAAPVTTNQSRVTDVMQDLHTNRERVRAVHETNLCVADVC